MASGKISQIIKEVLASSKRRDLNSILFCSNLEDCWAQPTAAMAKMLTMNVVTRIFISGQQFYSVSSTYYIRTFSTRRFKGGFFSNLITKEL